MKDPHNMTGLGAKLILEMALATGSEARKGTGQGCGDKGSHRMSPSRRWHDPSVVLARLFTAYDKNSPHVVLGGGCVLTASVSHKVQVQLWFEGKEFRRSKQYSGWATRHLGTAASLVPGGAAGETERPPASQADAHQHGHSNQRYRLSPNILYQKSCS